MIIGFVLYSALCFWIIFMDGAEIIEGWRAFFLFDWIAGLLTPSELRVYVAISWLAAAAVLAFYLLQKPVIA